MSGVLEGAAMHWRRYLAVVVERGLSLGLVRDRVLGAVGEQITEALNLVFSYAPGA